MLPRPRRKGDTNPDVDVTPFMNLMAVLSPFLLATAVFTHVSVLEIYLPPPSDALDEEIAALEEEHLTLMISVTGRGFVVANGTKIIKFIGIDEATGKQDIETLSNTLRDLKIRYPDEENAIILSTPEIAYGTIVSVMDTTRITLDKEKSRRYELFPNVSLGEVQ